MTNADYIIRKREMVNFYIGKVYHENFVSRYGYSYHSISPSISWNTTTPLFEQLCVNIIDRLRVELCNEKT